MVKIKPKKYFFFFGGGGQIWAKTVGFRPFSQVWFISFP